MDLTPLCDPAMQYHSWSLCVSYLIFCPFLVPKDQLSSHQAQASALTPPSPLDAALVTGVPSP